MTGGGKAYVASSWDEAKKPLAEVAVPSVELPCPSVDFFLDTFLKDGAACPIEKYQKEVVGDKNIGYSQWGTTNDNVMTRNINFVHPLKNKVGPKKALTSRIQQLQTFEDGRLILTNTTRIKGVPGADCFRAEDKWVIQESKGIVTMTVSSQLVFEKRTMAKGIIQKNHKSETKKWLQGYLNFVKEQTPKNRLSMQQASPLSQSKHLLLVGPNNESIEAIPQLRKCNSSESSDTSSTTELESLASIGEATGVDAYVISG